MFGEDSYWEQLCQEEEDKSQIEFILSYFYALIKNLGPVNVESLEEIWNEQSEFFTDVSFYVTHGISNFLLNSRKFKFIDGVIEIVHEDDVNAEESKLSVSKTSSPNKMCDVIKTELPTVDEIITYNIELNKSLIESTLNHEDNDIAMKVKLLESITYKINSMIIFSNVRAESSSQDSDQIQICVRPAVEYSTNRLKEQPLRLNGYYSFKYNVHDRTDLEIDLISELIRKHLLLLDYRNDDTLECFIFNVKNGSAKIDDALNDFDRYLINNNNNEDDELLKKDCFQSEFLLMELKNKYKTAVQKFLFECEIQKRILGDENQKLQTEVFEMAAALRYKELTNNKFQYQCMNYLIFIRNLIGKQIKSFQDKAIKILTFVEEIKPYFDLENNSTSGITLWKLQLYETKQVFQKIRTVFETFKFVIICEEILNLETMSFVTRKEEPPYGLHSQIKEIIKYNVMCKKQEGNTTSIPLEILQEYICGPSIGILNKPKHTTKTDKTTTTGMNDFKQAFTPGFVPRLYFIKPNHNLNIICNQKSKTIGKKIKTNIQDTTGSLSNLSDLFFQTLKFPSNSTTIFSVTETLDHKQKLRIAISKLNKHVFSTKNCNRFELILKSECRTEFAETLTITDLVEKLSEYITKYSQKGCIYMSQEKLRFFDFMLLPITILFGVQTKMGSFDPFISIRCNCSRTDNLPSDIEMEIKKLRREMKEGLTTTGGSTSILNDQSFSSGELKWCPMTTNDVKVKTSGFPFLNEPSESSRVTTTTDPLKTILITSKGATPKDSTIRSKNKRNKRVSIQDNLETCCICRDTYRRQSKFYLQCKHSFHKECIEIWRENSHKCPVCRATIEYDEFPPLCTTVVD